MFPWKIATFQKNNCVIYIVDTYSSSGFGMDIRLPRDSSWISACLPSSEDERLCLVSDSSFTGDLVGSWKAAFIMISVRCRSPNTSASAKIDNFGYGHVQYITFNR